MIRYLRPARPRRPSVPRGRHQLRAARQLAATLRPEPAPEPYDPCGNDPIDTEAARRRAIGTLIATMGRYMR